MPKVVKKRTSRPRAKNINNPADIFGQLPDDIVVKIISYIYLDVKKKTLDEIREQKFTHGADIPIRNWFRIYQNWALACKSNYNFMIRHGLSAVPQYMRPYVPQLINEKQYGSYTITTTVKQIIPIFNERSQERSHFLAQLAAITSGPCECFYCQDQNKRNYYKFYTVRENESIYGQQYNNEIYNICEYCAYSRFIRTETLIKLLKINDPLFIGQLKQGYIKIYVPHAYILCSLLFGETIDTRCNRLWSQSFSDCLRNVTFGN